jgi:hypothetical protein
MQASREMQRAMEIKPTRAAPLELENKQFGKMGMMSV